MKRTYPLAGLLLAMFCAISAGAQTNVISNNKSLAFLNPALQNYEFEKGMISISYLPNMLSEGSNYTNYVGVAEFKLNEAFRLGAHSSSINSRLNALNTHKVYSSYKFSLEEGNNLIMGLDLGMISDQTKTAEYNTVFYPTRTEFTDSISNSFTLGFGMAYATERLIIGLGIDRLNGPKIVPAPIQYWEFVENPDSTIVRKDTTILLGENDFASSRLQSKFHIIYNYDVGEKMNIRHVLSASNIDFNGADFIGLQNFITFNENFVIGLGVYDNGHTSYMASLGCKLGSHIKIEVATFIKEEFEFDRNALNPSYTDPTNRYPIDAPGTYVSVGYIPSFEANLRLEF